MTEPELSRAEAICGYCRVPIYLPVDRVCFATLDDDRRCPWSEWGWHEPDSDVRVLAARRAG